MDESVYFLDICIVYIAFTKSFGRIPCCVYDGRMHPAERNLVLESFRKASEARIP